MRVHPTLPLDAKRMSFVTIGLILPLAVFVLTVAIPALVASMGGVLYDQTMRVHLSPRSRASLSAFEDVRAKRLQETESIESRINHALTTQRDPADMARH